MSILNQINLVKHWAVQLQRGKRCSRQRSLWSRCRWNRFNVEDNTRCKEMDTNIFSHKDSDHVGNVGADALFGEKASLSHRWGRRLGAAAHAAWIHSWWASWNLVSSQIIPVDHVIAYFWTFQPCSGGGLLIKFKCQVKLMFKQFVFTITVEHV